MMSAYETSRDAKTITVEPTTREGFPYRIVITLQKLGVVTMLDYFVSADEAQGIVEALSARGADARAE